MCASKTKLHYINVNIMNKHNITLILKYPVFTTLPSLCGGLLILHCVVSLFISWPIHRWCTWWWSHWLLLLGVVTRSLPCHGSGSNLVMHNRFLMCILLSLENAFAISTENTVVLDSPCIDRFESNTISRCKICFLFAVMFIKIMFMDLRSPF